MYARSSLPHSTQHGPPPPHAHTDTHTHIYAVTASPSSSVTPPTGIISFAKTFILLASAAFLCDERENWSWSAREILNVFATFSLIMNTGAEEEIEDDDHEE